MEEQQVILKTSTFGGFERKGVLNYIDEMNMRAKAAQDSLNQKLEEVSAARNDLTAQISSFSEKITGLEEQLKNEREKINELTGVINDLNAELSSQKETISFQEAELRNQQERNRKLQFKAESMEYKSRKYDEATMKVGSVLLEARESADRILEQARQEAEALRAMSEQSMGTISGEIESFRGDVANLRHSIVEVMSSITQKLDGLDRAIDNIEGRCDGLMGMEPADHQTVVELPGFEEQSGEAPAYQDRATAGQVGFF